MADDTKVEPNYDGYRWIGAKYLLQDEKLYCQFCEEAIVYFSEPGMMRSMAHILLDEEEFDPMVACEACFKRIIGDLYPPDDKRIEAAMRDRLPLCECGKQTFAMFMLGHGIMEHTAACECGQMTEVDKARWPYRESEALFRTSPIWKAFAPRGYGGVGAIAAQRLYHERKLKELEAHENPKR